jgi:hypothetical protein
MAILKMSDTQKVDKTDKNLQNLTSTQLLQELEDYNYFNHNNNQFSDKAIFTSHFWDILTECFTRPELKPVFVTAFENIFTDRHIYQTMNNQFVHDLGTLLKKQTIFSKPELISVLQNTNDWLLIHSIIFKQYDNVPVFKELAKSLSLKDVASYHPQIVKTGDLELIQTFYNTFNDLNYNNSEILRSYLDNNVYDYSFINDTIKKYNLDINAVGNIGHQNFSPDGQAAFIHEVYGTPGSQATEFLKKFIVDYGQSINFDITESYSGNKATGLNYTSRNLNVLELVQQSTKLTIEEKLERLNYTLQYGKLTEKHIAQISNFLLSENVIINNYDHEVFDSLFKNTTFNSESVDRASILNKIFEVDGKISMYHARVATNNAVNPTTTLLKKFFDSANPSIHYQVHPFLAWSHLQQIEFSDATLPFMFKKYSSDIAKFTSDDFTTYVPKHVQKKLKALGISVPETLGWFKKMFGSKEAELSPVVVTNNIPEPIQTVIALEFDNDLFKKVKDQDIQKYISSIQLNAEQYSIVFNKNIVYESEHYMKNILPKFLNKTVENYLHFSTMDEVEAKDNVLVQLKLLNKKTFEVLNQGLQEEKEDVARTGRIHNRIIKNY